MIKNKTILFILILLVLFSCKKKEKDVSSEVYIDSIIKTDTIWQNDIGITCYHADTIGIMYNFIIFLKDNSKISFTDSFTDNIFSVREIRFEDMNFDNFIDLDIVLRPTNRIFANEKHNLWLNNKTNLIRLECPNLSYYFLDKSKKLVYTVYNSEHLMTFYKQKWQNDSLIHLEEIKIDINFDKETSTYSHYFFKGKDIVKEDNKIYSKKDKIKLPNDFDSIALYGIYFQENKTLYY